jgi:beta-phosphoglucomutase-like phosphatase (HAD superfamily)
VQIANAEIESGTVGALLFDWDGTLADTQQANYEALRRAFEEIGHSLDAVWYFSRTGLSTIDLIVHFAEANDASVDVDSLVVQRQRHYLGLLDLVSEVTVVADIARWQRGRLPLALATGGDRETVMATVDRLQLRGERGYRQSTYGPSEGMNRASENSLPRSVRLSWSTCGASAAT